MKSAIIFDAENIQIHKWYKRIKKAYVNKPKSKITYRLNKWDKLHKFSFYCQDNEHIANKSWNESVRAYVLEGSGKNYADDKIIEFIINKKFDKLYIASNDINLINRAFKAYNGSNFLVFYTNVKTKLPERIRGVLVTKDEYESKFNYKAR